MMKTGDKIRLAILLMLLTVILACAAVNLYRDVCFKKELVQENIYEIGACFDRYNSNIRVSYMVCRPAETQEEVKKQIQDFIERNNILEQLVDRSRKLGEKQFRWINLTFIKPTEHWPIGTFYQEEEELLFYPEMIAYCVTVDLKNPEILTFHYWFVNPGN